MTTACLSPPIVVASRTVVASSHRAMLDAARLVAVYSIVWLHTVRSDALEGSRALGRFAVPFFVFAAVLLVFEGLRRQPGRAFAQYARSRLVRLYLPFLAWSGVYLMLKATKAALLPEQPNDFPGLSILWVGSFYHLWFLPFILAVSLGAFVVAKGTLGRPELEWCVGAAAAAEGILLALAPAPDTGLLAGPYGHLVANALPAACWAVALAVLMRRPAGHYLQQPAASLAGLALAAVCLAWTWHVGASRLAENLAGLGVMLVALGPIPAAWVGRMSKLGSLSYGIYLAHLLFIKVFEAAATRLHWAVSWQLDAAIFLASAVLSTLLAWALLQGRWTRWLAA